MEYNRIGTNSTKGGNAGTVSILKARICIGFYHRILLCEGDELDEIKLNMTAHISIRESRFVIAEVRVEV